MPTNDTTVMTRESEETTGSLDEPKDLGQNDARFIDALSNVAEKAADSVSHALHPVIERFA